MTVSNTFRGVALVTMLAAASVVWVVYRTVQRAQDSTQWVVHAQEVLTAIDAVGTSVGDADSGLRRFLASADPQALEPLDRAEHSIDADIGRLSSLTTDNPRQQGRTADLHRDTRALLAALRAQATSSATATDRANADREQAALESIRRTIRASRAEENGVMADRVGTDQDAVRRLQTVSDALIATTLASIVWIIWLFVRDVRRERDGTRSLLRAKEDLEIQIGTRAAALRDSNERLRAIIDSAVDGILVIDATGHIEAFNRSAERLFGYPASEVLGRNVSMLMPSPYHEEHDAYLARYLETGVAKIIGSKREVSGRRRDGTTFPMHLSVGEMSMNGERKFSGLVHDLSERVRLEEELRSSEERWRSIVGSAVDGIVVIDAYGRIEAFNAGAERLFGYEEGEVIGRNVNMLMPAPYHDEHDAYLTRHLVTGAQKIIGTGREVSGLRRDGTTFPLHLSVGKLMVGGERKFTGILHDLTARVQMEEQLREQASLAKLGEMAAVIAHEVRNPLAGMRGALQIIGGRLPATSDEAQIIAEIMARIDTLNEVMKDLLLFARPPQVRPAPMDLTALLMATADFLRTDPQFEAIQFKVEGAASHIVADGDLLKIVFENLLINASHAMQGRGTIGVSLSAVADRCEVAVVDAGPGIPPENLARIFTPFFTTKAHGSGLGLPTAKRIVEAHNGSIRIACPPGGGTVVTVQLPGGSPALTH